jgi:hypothetical protein
MSSVYIDGKWNTYLIMFWEQKVIFVGITLACPTLFLWRVCSEFLARKMIGSVQFASVCSLISNEIYEETNIIP